MNEYKIIDEKNWQRAAHCAIFRNCIEPNFCVTFEVDVTNFYRKVKEQNLSFTLSMVYAVCKCGNEIENFRYRFVDDAIVLFDKIDTAFTWLNLETELFKVVNVPLTDNLQSYVELADSPAEGEHIPDGPAADDQHVEQQIQARRNLVNTIQFEQQDDQKHNGRPEQALCRIRDQQERDNEVDGKHLIVELYGMLIITACIPCVFRYFLPEKFKKQYHLSHQIKNNGLTPTRCPFGTGSIYIIQNSEQ